MISQLERVARRSLILPCALCGRHRLRETGTEFSNALYPARAPFVLLPRPFAGEATRRESFEGGDCFVFDPAFIRNRGHVARRGTKRVIRAN